jgi:EmrB/QacA subfamily drug resistance transporter
MLTGARAERAPDDTLAPGAVLGLSVSVMAMALLPVTVTGMNLAVSAIQAEFGSSLAALSWSLSGYSIVLAALTLLGGAVAARLGYWTTFMAGLAVFTAGSALCAAAPGTAVLIAGRVVQGAGGALIVPASVSVALAGWPDSRRSFAIGVWTAAFPIGSSGAPILAALLLDAGSWRWIFVVTGALGAAALVLGWFLPRVPKTSAAVPAWPDILGMTLGTVAVGLLALGIVQGRSWGWTSLGVLGPLVVAAGLVPYVVWRSTRHPRPFLPLRLFEVTTFRVGNIANVFVSMIGMSMWLVWPLVLSGLWNYSALQVGLAMSPTPILGGTISVAVSRWNARHGFRLSLLIGSVTIVAANAWFLFRTQVEPDYWGVMFPGLVLMGMGMGLTFAPLNAAALVDLDRADFPAGNATFSTGRFLSAAIGIAAVVAMLGEGDDAHPTAPFERAYLLLLVIAVVAFVILATMWPKRRPGDAAAYAAPP